MGSSCLLKTRYSKGVSRSLLSLEGKILRRILEKGVVGFHEEVPTPLTNHLEAPSNKVREALYDLWEKGFIQQPEENESLIDESSHSFCLTEGGEQFCLWLLGIGKFGSLRPDSPYSDALTHPYL
ncbi:hypothetical protein AKJ61_04410 [candidate division MSBL1 archaeon SCGC-AAA259B11]|uniref:Uncharacterized protein n=1 Tax=candidate division MSBL1 archaeon SCGC-AAA259B11 TaxID=1698260 RepID=A0A133U3B9_9EURY|nr:hypothetical protein AKJ61_04410 [candidate division MSBL1 archaeon SCGC-AAA259B11]